LETKRNRVKLFGTPVDAWTMNETVDFINQNILEQKQLIHTCINANKVVLMDKDKELHKSVSEADIISADGQAVVWASRLLKSPLPERVPGIDLMENLIQLAGKKKYSVFFFGARQEVVEQIAAKYVETHSPDIVGGIRNGYYTDEELPEIANMINNSGSQMLFVAIPSPQKENFIHEFASKMPNVLLLMGV